MLKRADADGAKCARVSVPVGDGVASVMQRGDRYQDCQAKPAMCDVTDSPLLKQGDGDGVKCARVSVPVGGGVVSASIAVGTSGADGVQNCVIQDVRCKKVDERCITHNVNLVCVRTRKRLCVRSKSGVYRHVYKLVSTWNCPVWYKANH